MQTPRLEKAIGLCSPEQEERPSLEALFQRCYATLRHLARRHLRQEREDHTLSSAALIHEAYLKLLELERVPWRSEAHFLGVASCAMRRLLVDSARRKRALKRQSPVAASGGPAEVLEPLTDAEAERLLVLEDVLSRLAEVDAVAGRAAELRYFGGLSLEEVAEALELSYATARRRWDFAKAWLRRELTESV